MTNRNLLLLVLCGTLIFSCKDYFNDDFQLEEPSGKRINISFPSLVTFEITQTVTPDLQGLSNEVANTFSISNELSQTIHQFKFGINIFDSSARFQENLVVSYVDSIEQSLDGFGTTSKKLFNTSFSSVLTEEMIDIFILDQDVLDTNPFSGVYVGEAFYYQQPDSTPYNIPYVSGAIDYKGDLDLRASGNQVADYNISGRLSMSGQFIGETNSSDGGSPITLETKVNAVDSLHNGNLHLTIVPISSPSLDSIILVLIRN